MYGVLEQQQLVFGTWRSTQRKPRLITEKLGISYFIFVPHYTYRSKFFHYSVHCFLHGAVET